MTSKRLSITFIALLFLSSLIAQSSTGTEVEFTTNDNITISASYLVPETKTKSFPAIILIHQGGSSRQEWFQFPMVDQLLKEGYVLLAYDIRQHGKSEKDQGDIFNLFNNPKRAPLDLQAAIQFLEKDDRIDKKRIGILGASVGANLACVAAASDEYSIKSVVSISSKTEAAQNLSGKEEPLSLKNAFHIASENEQGGLRKKWAEELYTKTTGKRKIVIAEGSLHGAYILKASSTLTNQVIKWFKETL
ncbi:alpha/beta fold hydrolase [Flavobacteriaceae bacterium R38]|nr:alpha/beta fold hydrolase [Flavobacteriaceae bacterium R38]